MSIRSIVKSIQDIMRQDSGVDGDAQRISQLCWMFFLKIIDDQDQQLELMQEGYISPIPKQLQWRSWAADPEGITGDELQTFVNTELFPKLKSLSVAGEKSDRRRVVRDVFEDAYNYMKSGQLMRQVVNKISEVDFNNLAERQHFGDIYEQILNDLQSAGNAGEYYTPRALTAFMTERIDPRPGEILLDPACGTGGFLTCAIRHMRDKYVKTVEDEQAMQKGLRAVEKKQLPHMLCVTNMLLHGVENPSFVRHDNTLARPYISYSASDRVEIVLTNPPFGGREEDGIESNFPKHFQTRETADLFLALIVRLLKPGGRAAVVLPDGSLFGDTGIKKTLKEHLLQECNLHTIVRLPNSVFKPYATVGTNLLFFEKGEPTRDIWFYEHRVPADQKAYSMTKPIRLEHLNPCVEWWGGAERKGRVETEFSWRVSIDEVKARGYDLDFKNPHTVAADHGNPVELLAKFEETERQKASLSSHIRSVLETSSQTLPELLFGHFDKLSAAPDATNLLRNFILDLAVRGRLLDQNPQDEPASQLLKRIDAEKAKLTKDGKNGSQKSFPAIVDDDLPFQAPSGWQWARLGNISRKIHYGYTASANSSLTDVRLLRITDIQNNCVDWPSVPGCEISNTEVDQYRLERGDILIARTGGTIGKTFLVSEVPVTAVFASYLIRVQKAAAINDEYLKLFLESPVYWKQLEDGARGAGQPNVNGQTLGRMVVPIPPASEQSRIVARVRELMVLCDKLQNLLDTGLTQNRQLLEAILHHALVTSQAAPVTAQSA
jgi:type I restriction enzyme M protein